MTEKQKYLKAYLDNLAISLNKQYPGIIAFTEVDKMYQKYENDTRDITVIVSEIEDFKNNLIRNHKNRDNEPKVDKARKEEIDRLTEHKKALEGIVNHQSKVNTLEERVKEKPKVFTKIKPNNFGFANTLIFTLLVGFALGTIVTTAYIFINIGKYTFTI